MKAILSLIDQALAVPGTPPSGGSKPRATAKAVLGALAVLFVSFVLFVGSLSAQSFNTTNVLSAQSPTANTILSGYPTNSIGTNTLGQGVGGAVSVANNDFVLLTCSMFVCTNVAGGTPTTNNIMLQLIRSGASAPPSLGPGTNLFTTNVTNIIVQPWETYSNNVPAFSQMIIPVTTTFGCVTWSTNLSQTYVSGANWLGIGQIYVNATNFFATNFAVTLSKKIIPIRYP